jgi:DNA-binding transcriptional LysR family regulator
LNIDPRHLPAVLAIVEHGSFVRAAEALGMSQPALSKNIALLEYRLGARLFIRGPKGAVLTEAGEVVARSARNLDSVIRRAQDEIEALAGGSEAALTVGVSPSLMLRLVPQTLARLSNEGLASDINLVEGLDDALTTALRDGQLDMVVGPIQELHGAPSDLVETRLALDRYFIGMNPRHPLAARQSLQMAELADQQWVLPLPNSTHYRVVEGLFTAAGLAWPKGVIATNSPQTLERLIGATDRLCLITGAMFLGGPGAILPIPLDNAPVRSIGVKQRRDHLPPRLAERFVAALAQAASGLSAGV